MKIQESVRKESRNILVFDMLACIVMLAVFFVLHRTMPERVPFDYRVVLGGVLGSLLASLNFFWMGMSVQGVVSAESRELAYQKMRLSYRNRTMVQLLWLVLCMVLPQIHVISGILPLLFPGIFIKVRGVLKKN